MAYVNDLLEQADVFAKADGLGKPRQANLRRAVSAAYYALFHAINDGAVRTLLGSKDANGLLGARLSRVIEHRSVLIAAKWFASDIVSMPPSIGAARESPKGPIDANLRRTCEAVISLQDERHRADYDLWKPFVRNDVLAKVEQSRRAVDSLEQLDSTPDTRLFFLGCLFGERLRRNDS